LEEKLEGGTVMGEGIILFADNDPDFLRTRTEFLEQEGYLVVPAADLGEAKRKLTKKGKIDLAVIDIRLVNDDDERDISGLNLAKEVAHSVPKIILTGFPAWTLTREALHQVNGPQAAVDFLAKQDGPQVLLQRIEEVLSAVDGQEVEALASGEGQPRATKSQQDRVRLASGIVAMVTLLLAVGTGIVAVVTGDPRWLLATVFLAISMVIGTGLAIFMPE